MRRHASFLGGLAAGLLAAGAVAFAATRGGDEHPKPPPRTPTATEPAQQLAPRTAHRGKKRPAWPRRIGRDYEMFSRAGNEALRAIIVRAAHMLRHGATRDEVMSMVRREYGNAEARFDEATDTAVCDRFADELDLWLMAAGKDVIDAFDEFAF